MHAHIDLTVPSPAEIRAARVAAGLTQAEACPLADIANQSAWAEYESGRRPMPAYRWFLFLLRTNQHPDLKLVRRKR